MGSRVFVSSLAVELCVVLAAASGCSSGSPLTGFGPAPYAKPVGANAASASVTTEYGITEWRTYVGRRQTVVTGYRADGTAARGMEFAWFASTPQSVGHTRITMLDGTGAVLRRMVGGAQTGHLSNAQFQLIQTVRADLTAAAPAPSAIHGASVGGGGPRLLDNSSGVHLLDDSNSPCATKVPPMVVDGAGCGMAVGKVVVSKGKAGVPDMLGNCGQFGVDVYDYATCEDPPATDPQPPQPMPQQQCDSACMCANYGQYDGMPCNTPCTSDAGCSGGQVCSFGGCGLAPQKNDTPTDKALATQNPTAASCDGGDVTANPSNGQVACSSGNDSGGSSGGGSGSSGGDPGATDPTTGGGSGGGSGGSSSGGACAGDGAGCAQDADCCVGACNSGTCGASASDPGGSSSGGSSGSSSGGSGSGSSSGGGCASDGSGCAQNSDCCSGTCDTTTSTCGTASSSSSGGGSGSGSGGGGCGNPGDGCAQDSDCCSGSCDTSSGTCN